MRTFLQNTSLEEEVLSAEFETTDPGKAADEKTEAKPPEDTEALKAERDRIRAYLLSKKGYLHTFQDLPLQSVFNHIYARVHRKGKDVGYVEVSRETTGEITSRAIDEEAYYLQKPGNSLILQAFSDNGLKVDMYLSASSTLKEVVVVYRDPAKVAEQLYVAYAGLGTDNATALEIFEYLGAAAGSRFGKVAEVYQTSYSAKRGDRSLIEDTIYEMIDTPEKLREAFALIAYDASPKVLEWLRQEDNATDSLAFALRDEDMAAFKPADRVDLISFLSRGNVGNPDEETIIRLLATTPPGDISDVFNKLSANDSAILERLESKINFSEYKEYHQTIFKLYQLNFLLKNTPKQVADALENPKTEFAYRNPSKITNALKQRHYIDDIGFKNGKVSFLYWSLGPGFGFSSPQSFSPFEPITILFLDDEPAFDAKAGERIRMPALNLFALEDEQSMREMKLATDIALTVSGAGGIFSAASKAGKIWAGAELLMGVADITINELRSDIAETESGREFLKYWDIATTVIAIYGIGKAVLTLPQIFRKLKDNYKAYKNISKLDKNELRKIDELMAELKASIDKAKSDARKNILDPNNTAHINARESAWKKYEVKNPGANYDAYKKKYDTLAINREAGVLTEAQFQLLKGGAPKVVYTSGNKKRVIDNLINGIAREIKSGKVSLSTYKEQIDKDLDLLNIKGNGINKIEWHCFDGVDDKFYEYIKGMEQLNPALKGKFEIINYSL